MGLIVVLTHSIETPEAFISGRGECLLSSIPVPLQVAEDIKPGGFVSSFLRKTKSRLILFFFLLLLASHFSGCQAVVSWKQWKGQGGKHTSLPMQILLSAMTASSELHSFYAFKRHIQNSYFVRALTCILIYLPMRRKSWTFLQNISGSKLQHL